MHIPSRVWLAASVGAFALVALVALRSGWDAGASGVVGGFDTAQPGGQSTLAAARWRESEDRLGAALALGISLLVLGGATGVAALHAKDAELERRASSGWTRAARAPGRLRSREPEPAPVTIRVS